MRFIKQKLAMVLAVLLMMPAQLALADNTLSQNVVMESVSETKSEFQMKDSETKATNEDETKSESTSKGAEEEVKETIGNEESVETTEESAEDGETTDVKESEKETEESKKESEESEESGEESEKTEESESESESESRSESESETDFETKSENKKLVEQIVSIVQEQIQKVVNSEKKKLLADQKIATPSEPVKTTGDEVKFNTGNHVYSVVSKDDFLEKEIGDAFFEEDGSFIINIPEENPFFPYEVQFTYKKKTVNKWFMNPDDSVEVGGHTFYVSAYFDGTAVTQMSFEVAGDTVVVYPKRKTFTDEDEGAVPTSLLPLEERELTVDFTGRTPLELTKVLVDDVFAGETPLQKGQKVVWKYGYYDKENYIVSSVGDKIDLSRYTYAGSNSWEMIVGEDDQLAADNIRYIIDIEVTKSEKWLIPTVYTQNEDGKRIPVTVLELENTYIDGYYDYYPDEREMVIHVSSKELDKGKEAYVGLEVNSALFGNSQYDHVKVYEGEYADSKSAEKAGKEITNQLFVKDMTKKDAGYRLKPSSWPWITIVGYDAAGKEIGCLSFELYLSQMGNSILYYGLYDWSGGNRSHVSQSTHSNWVNGCNNLTYTLEYGYSVNKEYHFVMEARKEGIENPSIVTAAYAGKYSSIGEAEKAGAIDIKDELFNTGNMGGYKANYSKGVYFSIFVGKDGSKEQEIYNYYVKAEEGELELSGNTLVSFYGLRDANGKDISCYTNASREDSYADYSYITLLVGKDVNLTNLAPVFRVQEGLKLYADDGKEQISGESFHDFSKGPVQYTASAENKKNGKNYWVQVVKPVEGEGNLFINSLKDPDANTKISGGVTTSVREMVIDGRSDYQHDILLINIGTGALNNLSAELKSDDVELDSYWTLKGNHSLEGFSTISMSSSYGELPNMAKLRIQPKEGVESGKDISGTLTIKSGNKTLVVLTLTGTIGDPSITTKEIPRAVKYVPYGVMIQNNNKYSWNKVSYSISGALPGGMRLEENGELYGVPTEAGEFTFTVRMRNSHSAFKDSQKTFTLTVLENTDTNVDGSTDTGYTLSQRIPDIGLNSSGDYLLVSQGEYATFKYIFLDGVQLKEGTDYTSEAGSTRITIRSQTLKASNKTGVHTLGIEFRTGKSDGESDLKRAAQNYRVTGTSSFGGSSSSGSSSSGRSTRSGGATIIRDSKKGYVHSELGIVTMEKAGYSHWQQDETGWKLIYADGTTANGYMTTLENGDVVEQVIWEKINGSWYAFGVDGYIKSGWVYDYRLGKWYSLSVDTGMRTGWYTDNLDTHTYYLDPEEGGMAAGWWRIDRKWYYFNTVVTEATWELNRETGNWQYNTKSKSKPFGAMYRNENTPDGYYVNADGVWDKK